MSKYVKTAITFAVILIFLFSALTVASRKFYGIWNPFKTPLRVSAYDRTYKLSPNPKVKTLKDNDKPKYKVAISLLDLVTGKKLYMSHPKGEFVPTVIYLHAKGNDYYALELSGGP